MTPPCLLHEDDDLLVVNKPPGWSTHAPSPFHPDGIYDWLRWRRNAKSLSILHRLDKETSGVLVFGKSTLANRELSRQFEGHLVRKSYQLLTDREPAEKSWQRRSFLLRAGEKYVEGKEGSGSLEAITDFEVVEKTSRGWLVTARPLTGRTHQIRVHAAASGIPVLGDDVYGGAKFSRTCLHSAQLSFTHPATGTECSWSAAPDFESPRWWQLRRAMFSPETTDAYRLIQGSADGFPGFFVDRWGGWLLIQSATDPSDSLLKELRAVFPDAGIYHKRLRVDVGLTAKEAVAPQKLDGPDAPADWLVKENGTAYRIQFDQGYSVGLFLDQLDNRQRLLRGFAPRQGGAGRMLNLFAYTCGFSVSAALAGWQTLSLDLSKNYLEWGKRNFEANGLSLEGHDFVFGDTFDWLKRFRKKGRLFDLIVLDPPTFSRSKESGVFRAEKDYQRLVEAVGLVLAPGGTLLASTNAAEYLPERFLDDVKAGLLDAGHQSAASEFRPQPPDFPVTREEPGYLKTVWVTVN